MRSHWILNPRERSSPGMATTLYRTSQKLHRRSSAARDAEAHVALSERGFATSSAVRSCHTNYLLGPVPCTRGCTPVRRTCKSGGIAPLAKFSSFSSFLFTLLLPKTFLPLWMLQITDDCCENSRCQHGHCAGGLLSVKPLSPIPRRRKRLWFNKLFVVVGATAFTVINLVLLLSCADITFEWQAI